MANTSNLDLVKPAGTDHALISVINSNMDKVDAYAGKVNTSLAGVEDGLAIVATGNTHAAITAGQFVYVKEHNTLPEGLYTASSNIAANATLSTTNLTADSKGGLNALSDHIANIESITTGTVTEVQALSTSGTYTSYTVTTSGWYSVKASSGNTSGYGLSRIAIGNTVVVNVTVSLGQYDQLLPPPIYLKAGTGIKGMATFPTNGSGGIVRIS